MGGRAADTARRASTVASLIIVVVGGSGKVDVAGNLLNVTDT